MRKDFNLNSDVCVAVKSKNGEYYCGYNQWDKQIRKAKLYRDVKMAEKTKNDKRFIDKNCDTVFVHISEVDEWI